MPFALLLTIVLAALAVSQLALALGAPIGRFAWGGRHRVLPIRLRVGSAVSIVVDAAIALVAWARVGVFPQVDPAPLAVAMRVVFASLTLGIAMNATSRSKAERNTMVPLRILLAAVSLLIAPGYGRLALAA